MNLVEIVKLESIYRLYTLKWPFSSGNTKKKLWRRAYLIFNSGIVIYHSSINSFATRNQALYSLIVCGVWYTDRRYLSSRLHASTKKKLPGTYRLEFQLNDTFITQHHKKKLDVILTS